jgi:large subunit ribosomal protein L19
MNNKLLSFNDSQKAIEMPAFRAGDVVKVFRKIIKGKQSSSTMITVRKVSNGVGVEIVVPIQSPSIEKIEVVKRAKVRQSKLYFVRERSAKSLKMKYSALAAFAKVSEKDEVAAPEEKVVEDVKEEAPAEAKAE